MATINLDYSLVNMEGEPLMRGEAALTARQLIREALLADIPNQPTEASEMVACDDLQNKIRSGCPDLVVEELSLMKKWCGKVWGKIVYAQLVKIIDGKADPLCD